MDPATLFGLCGAALVALGAWGLIVRGHPLRRLLGFNMLGSGVFLFLGSMASRHGPAVDPVPQAMIITGVVVALAATALALVLVVRIHEEGSGEADAGPG